MAKTLAHITRKQSISQTDVVQPKNWNAALLKPMRTLVKPVSARLRLRDRPIRRLTRHRPDGATTLRTLVTLPVHVDGPAFRM